MFPRETGGDEKPIRIRANVGAANSGIGVLHELRHRKVVEHRGKGMKVAGMTWFGRPTIKGDAALIGGSSMFKLSKNPRSQGVDPSPTPMAPTVGDSTKVISTPCSVSERANVSAVIQPAVPPPTMRIRRSIAGKAD